jgi:RimJ/RimL family protein N-acetyltransferase
MQSAWHSGVMSTSVWPLFGLRVITPRLELRYVDDHLGAQLADLAAQGIHDPAFMPFAFEWTDAPADRLRPNTMQHYWRCRAETTPTHWHLPFATIVDGEVVGTTSLGADHFPTLRTFESGSWLGRAHQGRGIGREMREATLHLGFAGFAAACATTSAFDDNGPSLGVTRSLGYEPNGTEPKVRRGQVATSLQFRMPADDWQARVRRDDISIDGLEPVLGFLALV